MNNKARDTREIDQLRSFIANENSPPTVHWKETRHSYSILSCHKCH